MDTDTRASLYGSLVATAIIVPGWWLIHHYGVMLIGAPPQLFYLPLAVGAVAGFWIAGRMR